MRLRRLGRSDLLTSPIGLNAVSFASGCGPVDRHEAHIVISQLLETTIALIDASDLTGSGDVAALVGRAVRGRRDKALLASRGGATYTVRGRLTSVDARPAVLAKASETALRLLGTDHLDLYYLDRVDPLVPLEDSMGALAAMVEAGKVRQVGLVHVDAEQLRRAHAIVPVAVVGAEYSLMQRLVEVDLLPTARALGVSLAAYSPLARGLLTGAVTSLDQLPDHDYRRADPRFWPENFGRYRAIAEAAERVASRRHLSVGRLALTWLLAQGNDIVPVPGTQSLTHLEMNLAAADVTLTAGERAELGALLGPPGTAEQP